MFLNPFQNFLYTQLRNVIFDKHIKYAKEFYSMPTNEK